MKKGKKKGYFSMPLSEDIKMTDDMPRVTLEEAFRLQKELDEKNAKRKAASKRGSARK